MQTAIEAARANDGEGYGRNTSEVASWKEILTAFGQVHRLLTRASRNIWSNMNSFGNILQKVLHLVANVTSLA